MLLLLARDLNTNNFMMFKLLFYLMVIVDGNYRVESYIHFKNSLIIHEENTKRNLKLGVSLYEIKHASNFNLYFLS